ncbi:hypothetical protein B0J11DRAFT_105782 [Dendryphion nanum]|uniref:3-hydroxyisobutyrate dehydrogenase protein n=1 Tax=Dendryphion nanum TaxID=256645 RepID=A0A9P9DDV9_9PLEO|nr:hypothetical protein B0J11DRAFT_105782 [Dendryphion nanum]
MRWRRKQDVREDDISLQQFRVVASDEHILFTRPIVSRRKYRVSRDYVTPSVLYPPELLIRHRDYFDRIWSGPQGDMYLSPLDGSLLPLKIQGSADILETGGHTWLRVELDFSNLPLAIALVPWSRYFTAQTMSSVTASIKLVGFWSFSCIGLFFMLPTGFAFGGKRTNNGRYDSILYKYRAYPKIARNKLEQDRNEPGAADPYFQNHWRPIFPRYLCTLRQPELKTMEGVYLRGTEDIIYNAIESKDMEYAYIAYTSTQFPSAYVGEENLTALHKLAERATRDAGLGAYWVACSCMPDTDRIDSDVYTLDSMCRNSSVMVVALGDRIEGMPVSRKPHKLELFRDFGSRLWCRPYLLHSPINARIKVYIRGEPPENHLSLSKREFALLAWSGEDALLALRLIDHQEGKMPLARVEFFVLCSKFLFEGHTVQYLLGDTYYVLMGLLQKRPVIDVTDDRWQAFCRLCLANESDKLLERLICHLSSKPFQLWAASDDVWGVPLWDIEPYIQVSGIGYNETVIIDGAYAASIRWDGFSKVNYRREVLWRHMVLNVLTRSSPVLIVISVILVTAGPSEARIASLVILILSTVMIIISPLIIRYLHHFDPKTHATNPCFFGIEGYVPLGKLSSAIFGDISPTLRLRWSTNSSLLSSHARNDYGECEGIDPLSYPNIAMLVEMSKKSQFGEPRVFTLVDTGSMTVTLFLARRPPISVLCCGQEGGMQRALLCSYDAATATLHRETILRMETTVLNDMNRIGRVQLNLNSERPIHPKMIDLRSSELANNDARPDSN